MRRRSRRGGPDRTRGPRAGAPAAKSRPVANIERKTRRGLRSPASGGAYRGAARMSGENLDQAAVLETQGRFEGDKPSQDPQFLQIVAKPDGQARRAAPEPKLTRVAFRVSRLMEFCSERELTNQT